MAEGRRLVSFMARGGKAKRKKMAKGGLDSLGQAMDSGMRLRSAVASPTRETIDTSMAGSKPPSLMRMPMINPRRRAKAIPVISSSPDPMITPPPMGGGFMRK